MTLIALSDRHFQAGRKELELGHVEARQAGVRRAVTVLMESPYGGRTDRASASISTGWSIASAPTK